MKVELCTKVLGLYMLLHSVKTSEKVFIKMLKDVGIEVPKSIETRYSMQTKAGDDSMQQYLLYRCSFR